MKPFRSLAIDLYFSILKCGLKACRKHTRFHTRIEPSCQETAANSGEDVAELKGN
jgi:hypothetical protein